LGAGSVDVNAARTSGGFRTTVTVRGLNSTRVLIGYALPRGSHPSAVTLNGSPVTNYRTVTTHRGTEVVVPAGSGRQVLTVSV
jgi:hypothetical protein